MLHLISVCLLAITVTAANVDNSADSSRDKRENQHGWQPQLKPDLEEHIHYRPHLETPVGIKHLIEHQQAPTPLVHLPPQPPIDFKQLQAHAQPQLLHQHQPQLLHQHQPQLLHQHQPQLLNPHQPQLLHQHQPQLLHQHQPQLLHPHQPQLLHQHQPQLLHQHQPQLLQPINHQKLQGLLHQHAPFAQNHIPQLHGPVNHLPGLHQNYKGVHGLQNGLIKAPLPIQAPHPGNQYNPHYKTSYEASHLQHQPLLPTVKPLIHPQHLQPLLPAKPLIHPQHLQGLSQGGCLPLPVSNKW